MESIVNRVTAGVIRGSQTLHLNHARLSSWRLQETRRVSGSQETMAMMFLAPTFAASAPIKVR